MLFGDIAGTTEVIDEGQRQYWYVPSINLGYTVNPRLHLISPFCHLSAFW